MNKCEYCKLLDEKKFIIAESQDVVIAVRDKVAIPGQITIFPKEHFTIMEMVPEEILQQCAILANKVSIAVFESLGSQGTNIIIRNGLGAGQDVPHFGVEVIPRREDDGLNFQWEPRQLMEDDIEITYNALMEGIRETKEKVEKIQKEDIKTAKKEKGKKNYLLKSLRRIP